jgi:hypothetical protein
LRIPPITRRPCRYIESAEARDTHRVPSREGVENGGYNGLHRLACQPCV